MKKASKISFHYLVPPFLFPDRRQKKSLIECIFRKEKCPFSGIKYVFCSDEYLLKMNKKYLGHDSLTDIITFPLQDPERPISADIYISVQRVRENSSLFNTSFQTELTRLLIHGALHLCGYKDKTRTEKSLMREREEIYLDLFHVK